MPTTQSGHTSLTKLSKMVTLVCSCARIKTSFSLVSILLEYGL